MKRTRSVADKRPGRQVSGDRSRSDVNERELALDVLLAVDGGEFLNRALGRALEDKRLSPAGRSFITALCQGVTERRITLDHYISLYSKIKPEKQRPVIRQILRMGIYQLRYMDRIPESAAVNESVKLAAKRGFYSLKGFVNGVLRSFQRQAPPEPSDLSRRYSAPEWICSLFAERFGDERARLMLEASLKHPPLAVWGAREGRALKADELEELIVSRDGRCDGRGWPEGSVLADELPRSLDGIYIQDPASQLAGYIASKSLEAGPARALKALDMCSAPGGKALYLKAHFDGDLSLTACDVSDEKAERIRENAHRLGISSLDIRVWDGREYDSSLQGSFDLVMADLPCSGLGVLSKKPDLKYRVKKEDIAALSALGRQIAKNAVRYLAPGGMLILSTCTVAREENEELMEELQKTGELEAAPFEELLPPSLRGKGGEQGSLLLLQGVDPCDGFYICRMKKI